MTSPPPRLSVVVPVHNVEPWLAEALDSLIAATADEDAEIICVNDGATDGSGEILRGYGTRIALIEQANGGYGKAVNVGMAAARGRYLAIFEPDDRVGANAYAIPMAMLDQTPEADLVRAPHLEWVDGEIRAAMRLGAAQAPGPAPPPGAFTAFDHPPALLAIPAIWSAVYRRDSLTRLGLTMPETPGAGYQDAHFSAVLLLSGARMLWSDRPFYYYRMDRAGASRQSRARTDEIFALFERVAADMRPGFFSAPGDAPLDAGTLFHAVYFLRILWFMERVAPGFQEEAFRMAHVRFAPLWRDRAARNAVAALLSPHQLRVFARFAHGRADAFRQQFGHGAPLPESNRRKPDFDLVDAIRADVWSLPVFARLAATPLAPAARALVNPALWAAAKALGGYARLRG